VHVTDATDHTNPSAGKEPSEEELRAYLQELRDTPVGQVLTEVLSVLLNAAQVKLGRHDGRFVLDTVALLTDAAAGALPEEIVKQIQDALSQLRLAQVEAEKQRTEDEPNDLPAPVAVSATTTTGDGTQAQQAASRLWTPS